LFSDEVHEWLGADHNLAEEFTDKDTVHLVCDSQSNIAGKFKQ